MNQNSRDYTKHKEIKITTEAYATDRDYMNDQGHDGAFAPSLYFIQEHGIISSVFASDKIYSKEARNFLINNGVLIRKSNYEGEKDKTYTEHYFYRNNIVSLKLNSNKVSLGFVYPRDIDHVAEDFKKFIVINDSNKSEIGLVTETHWGGLAVTTFDFDCPTVNLDINYGYGFRDIHEEIIKKLKTNKAGIMTFHGEPGTGKTSYLKYLFKHVDRYFIFLPNHLAQMVDSPKLISLLLNYKNSIVVIEEAEQLITSRENSSHSVVSALLNLSDGILGSVLNISVIATYNTKKEKIDSALLRKGRLMLDHKFDVLNIRDAQAMVDSLGKTHEVEKPMTLAEIYNLEDDNRVKQEEEEKKTPIGFGANFPS